jgi:hypothetical protein
MKDSTKRMLRKFKTINHGRMRRTLDLISASSGKSRPYILADMARNFAKRGIGYTDYFRGDYIDLTEAEKDTFVTTRSFYKILHYLNDYNYVGIFHNKLIFNEVFRKYLKRDFLNLKKAAPEEFDAFLRRFPVVFAKDPLGECGHGVEKIVTAGVEDSAALYRRLVEAGQYLVEEGIVQSDALNEINPNVVNSYRIVTLVKDGVAHVIGNALRVNQDDANVIGCSNDLYFSFAEDGHIDSHVIDDWGTVYETHPLTGKPFREVRVEDVAAAFELCRRAALEVPEVRYVGWDVGFSDRGPVLIEGNEYPGYGILQFYRLKDSRTGHWKVIRDVLGDEARNIKF